MVYNEVRAWLRALVIGLSVGYIWPAADAHATCAADARACKKQAKLKEDACATDAKDDQNAIGQCVIHAGLAVLECRHMADNCRYFEHIPDN